MSLTVHLENKKSPINTFISQNLPDIGERSNELRKLYHQHIPDVEPIILPQQARHLSALAGTAIEQRITWAFGAEIYNDTKENALGIIEKYQRRLHRLQPEKERERYVQQVQSVAKQVIRSASSVANGYDLDNRAQALSHSYEDEVEIAQHALAVAEIESIYYSSGNSLTSSFYGQEHNNPTIHDVFEQIPTELIDDLLLQTDRACQQESFDALRRQSSNETSHPSATFTGSEAVGGAVADLIVDKQLIDIKATSTVRQLKTSELKQLVGYALLDIEDEYEIESLGLYRTRSGQLFSITVTDFLRYAGAKEPIDNLREKFNEEVLEPLARQRAKARNYISTLIS